MSTILRWLLGAATDLSFVPALLEIRRRRRHFELFVGGFQLFSSFMFNSSQSLEVPLFLRELDWHFLSDALSLSLVCCLLVHCQGNTDENLNIVQRYVSFALAFIFKFRDSWDSAAWEALLILAYVGLALYGFLNLKPKIRSQFDDQSLQRGGACLGTALCLLILEQSGIRDNFGFILGLTHIFGAAAAYFVWKGVPAFDNKKNDDLQSPSFV